MSQVGTIHMLLARLNDVNILDDFSLFDTALREFNALIRLDEVPLSKYLLDGKNDSTEVEHSKGDASGNDTKFDPLSQSGLPVGFRIFIKSKMNTSQLQAITASSKEYGSGGFTLIKGPPGTGAFIAGPLQ